MVNKFILVGFPKLMKVLHTQGHGKMDTSEIPQTHKLGYEERRHLEILGLLRFFFFFLL